MFFNVASVRLFNRQNKIVSVIYLSYKRDTEFTILYYVNKTFVYILNAEVKIPFLDLK